MRRRRNLAKRGLDKYSTRSIQIPAHFITLLTPAWLTTISSISQRQAIATHPLLTTHFVDFTATRAGLRRVRLIDILDRSTELIGLVLDALFEFKVRPRQHHPRHLGVQLFASHHLLRLKSRQIYRLEIQTEPTRNLPMNLSD